MGDEKLAIFKVVRNAAVGASRRVVRLIYWQNLALAAVADAVGDAACDQQLVLLNALAEQPQLHRDERAVLLDPVAVAVVLPA